MSEIILRIRKLQSVSTTFVFFIVTISHKQRIIHGNPLKISFKKENPEMENYGHTNNEKCADCTAHCGYEPTAVDEATSTVRGMMDSAKMVFQ